MTDPKNHQAAAHKADDDKGADDKAQRETPAKGDDKGHPGELDLKEAKEADKAKAEDEAEGKAKAEAMTQAEAAKEGKKLLAELVAMNVKAKAQGYHLVEALVWAAQAAAGVDIRPDPPED